MTQDIESIEDVSMSTGDDGVAIDLGDIDGGTVLLADMHDPAGCGGLFGIIIT